MKFDKPVTVTFNATHRKKIQEALLMRKPADLQFSASDFTSGKGESVYLTSAQLKRLQAALNDGAQVIGIKVPIKQLTDNATGFSSVMKGKGRVSEQLSYRDNVSESDSLSDSERQESDSLSDSETQGQESDSLSDSEELDAVGLTTYSFRLSTNQLAKLQTSNGPLNLSISKDALEGSNPIPLTNQQIISVKAAIQKGAGVRLSLSAEQVQASKKSPIS